MSKLKPDITIRIKSRNGPGCVIDLNQSSRGRCIIRRDGKRSARMTESTPTQIGREIGKWLSGELPKAALRNINATRGNHAQQTQNRMDATQGKPSPRIG